MAGAPIRTPIRGRRQSRPRRNPAHHLRAGAQKAGQDPQAAFKAREQAIPARRFGSADEFGAVCASLCKVQAGYLTGQNILLDGGAFFEHVLTSVPREPSQAFLNARSDAYQGDSAGQNAPR